MRDKKEVMKDLGKTRKKRITIQKQEVTTDDIGQQISGWVDWQNAWAEINSLYGDEYYAAAAINEQDTLKLTLRYAVFINEMDKINYQIIYKNKPYDIKNIDFLNDNGMWVIIKALKRGV